MDTGVSDSDISKVATGNTKINGQEFKTLVNSGYLWLKTNQQVVNALNVFPVPDGDTGTNMLLTMQSALNEISNNTDTNIGKICQGLARGALMGSRGNSGVILSQLWRGFSRVMDNIELMDTKLAAQALAEARDTAYKGVVRPVEGTILTVAKDIATEAQAKALEENDLIAFLEAVIKAADESVERTPELLPILKQANVVDSGGKGLFFIFEGMLRKLQGKPLDTQEVTFKPLTKSAFDASNHEVEPGQDYEVVVDFEPHKELVLEEFYNHLETIGTSIQVGEGDGIYRMHIHVPTDKRYEAIDYIMNIGTISKVFIENLMTMVDVFQSAEEAEDDYHKHLTTVDPDQIAIVAVSPGPGISRIFASLGAAAIIEGGQTMNPSTEEIVAAFENLPTNDIIILPNNKNIILAAESAKQVSVKNIAVIPSKTIPQGLSAMLRYNFDESFDHLAEEMKEALQDVDTGEITIANRSVNINGVKVKEGALISLLNGNLIGSYKSLSDAVVDFLKQANTEDKERITFFKGKDLASHESDKVIEQIKDIYPGHEIELHSGGQPHYLYIISVE